MSGFEMPADVSSDIRDIVVVDRHWNVRAVREAFPLTPACEFPERPMHGCECNGCVSCRVEALVAA